MIFFKWVNSTVPRRNLIKPEGFSLLNTGTYHIKHYTLHALKIKSIER